MMNFDEAGKVVSDSVRVTREDISRAKTWLLEKGGGASQTLVEQWLTEHDASLSQNPTVFLEANDALDQAMAWGSSFGLRLSFFQAEWELIATGEMFPAGVPGHWRASLSGRSSHGSGALPINVPSCSYPNEVMRAILPPLPSTDLDVFLHGVNCPTLHSGSRDAIQQSLLCFQRGLYLPSTVMLAAAIEATWSGCGRAVALKLSLPKLVVLLDSQEVGIAKKVAEICKALDAPDGRALLKTVGKAKYDIGDLAVWTNNLRERRNALHWDKANSFVANHAETASLLMYAPQGIGTLEAVRGAC